MKSSFPVSEIFGTGSCNVSVKTKKNYKPDLWGTKEVERKICAVGTYTIFTGVYKSKCMMVDYPVPVNKTKL